MLIGQTVLAPVSNTKKYYSPWFPRQGDECTVVIEVLRASGAMATFNCQVQTKNKEDDDDPGSITNVGFAIAVSSDTAIIKTTTALRSGFLELVRYEYTLAGSSAMRWVHFRALAPLWERN